jgi:hypothetical protein
MRVLFLDVDGVLNSARWWQTREKMPRAEWEDENHRLDPRHFVDPENVAVLNRLLDASDARIVLASTWRNPHSVGDNRMLLHRMGVAKARQRVIGATPDLSQQRRSGLLLGKERGHEIQAWLNANAEVWGVESYVIVDDDADMLYLAPRLVQTDNRVGLTEADAARVLALFGEEVAP